MHPYLVSYTYSPMSMPTLLCYLKPTIKSYRAHYIKVTWQRDIL